MYDILCIHMTSHPLFVISHHSMTFTHTVFMSSHPGYLASHPLLLSSYLHSIEYSTLQYVFSQPHYMYDIIWILCDITKSLYDITRLYSWHHIHTIPDITPTVYDMTYTLLVTSQPLLFCKTRTMFLTLYSVYMTSHMLNDWKHNDCVWHDTQIICVIKPTWLMTSHTMYIKNHTHYCMTP